MDRELFVILKEWQKKEEHLPLLLRGARQVGKSYLIEYFGASCFENIVSINFEESPEYKACFETLKPEQIITKIEVMSQQKIVAGKTLLFLDEIQGCTNAIMALRYFKENWPQLHVIGAGSLLEFALREKGISVPVGRVQYLYLRQLSFREYLKATGNIPLLEFLQQATIFSGVPAAIHAQALQLVRDYMIIGGMPMVVSSYIKNKDLQESQAYQTLILRTYGDDFAKYAVTVRHKYLQQVYNRTPGLVGQQIKYAHISPDMDSRYLKEAIADLSKAGVIMPIYSTSGAGLPFETHTNAKKFKLLFLDIGLLTRAMKLEMELLFAKDLMLLNRGAVAEQFVGQELLAYQNPYDEPRLYYWSREEKSSVAEVDYLINVGSTIVPIEVKAGKTGTLKSLHILMKEKQLPLGVRISTRPLEKHDNILSIPFYMIDQLDRLVR
ncbi:MAG: hypothetical protein A3C55_04350 [Gammaproteobacteria bacterium RIFCSPHIGHO2_02_FULL_42_13]|nr:MAG: hypothetical protein A3C55_04350 [Gammaproteobacteria bacterium RIFCSPHIGHO2_02_FULL_42_13]OGT70755.1 MAG: hypothetical protein A3H43_05115 [Gammaproteobacteria bacterium RIFCSPLOWO2_02_FULL_42_9]